MSPEDQAQGAELAEKASPGEWWTEDGGNEWEGRFTLVHPGTRWRGFNNPINCGEDKETAEFIAFCSPDRVRGWVEEDRAKDAEIEALRGLIRRITKGVGENVNDYTDTLWHVTGRAQSVTESEAALLRTILNKQGA